MRDGMVRTYGGASGDVNQSHRGGAVGAGRGRRRCASFANSNAARRAVAGIRSTMRPALTMTLPTLWPVPSFMLRKLPRSRWIVFIFRLSSCLTAALSATRHGLLTKSRRLALDPRSRGVRSAMLTQGRRGDIREADPHDFYYVAQRKQYGWHCHREFTNVADRIGAIAGLD